MSFEPKSFIDIAKELENGVTEAHFRSIINRAYYGVFGHLRENLPISFSSDASVHQEVINFLKRSPEKNDRKIGSRLETLFKKRKDADYKYYFEVKFRSCDFVLKEAEDIILKFDSNKSDKQ